VAAARKKSAESSGDEGLPGGDGTPPIDFTTFVLSMSTSCMIQMGELASPDGASGEDLPMAKHTIEILAVLEDKTRGNLSGDEERVLHHVVDDLRARYLKKLGH
jgi:hypothetical protein